ncbi:unnamed protein product [Symbiodinium sp. CCMP2592]|nr:unnamed protein product [Symbiodinium sp. CCMP2592]
MFPRSRSLSFPLSRWSWMPPRSRSFWPSRRSWTPPRSRSFPPSWRPFFPPAVRKDEDAESTRAPPSVAEEVEDAPLTENHKLAVQRALAEQETKRQREIRTAALARVQGFLGTVNGPWLEVFVEDRDSYDEARMRVKSGFEDGYVLECQLNLEGVKELPESFVPGARVVQVRLAALAPKEPELRSDSLVGRGATAATTASEQPADTSQRVTTPEPVEPTAPEPVEPTELVEPTVATERMETVEPMQPVVSMQIEPNTTEPVEPTMPEPVPTAPEPKDLWEMVVHGRVVRFSVERNTGFSPLGPLREVKMEPGHAKFLAPMPQGVLLVKEDVYDIDPVFWSKNVTKVGSAPDQPTREDCPDKTEQASEQATDTEELAPAEKPAESQEPGSQIEEPPTENLARDAEMQCSEPEQAVEEVLGLKVHRTSEGWFQLTPRSLEDYEAARTVLSAKMEEKVVAKIRLGLGDKSWWSYKLYQVNFKTEKLVSPSKQSVPVGKAKVQFQLA